MAAFSHQQQHPLLPFADDVVDCYYDHFFTDAQSHELTIINPYDNTNGGDQFNDDLFGFGHFHELTVPSTITTTADNDGRDNGVYSVQESSSYVDDQSRRRRSDYDQLAVKSMTMTSSPSQLTCSGGGGDGGGGRRRFIGSSGSSSSSISDNSSSKVVASDVIVKNETAGKKKPRKKCNDDTIGYIHVRARRGQATDSHSLAERVRREKISERMKLLQSLVPGCDKVTGKAMVLDEIINYVQSLQTQVEFLSVKLKSLDPTFYTTRGTIGMDQQQQHTGSLLINELNSSSNMMNSQLLPPSPAMQHYYQPAVRGFFVPPQHH